MAKGEKTVRNTKVLWGVIAVLCTLLVVVVYWGKTTKGWSDRVVAKIGEEKISASELEVALNHRYGSQVLKELIDHRLVAREAEKLGLTVSPEEIATELNNMKKGYRSDAEFYQSIRDELGMNEDDLKADIRNNLLMEKIATKDVQISDAEAKAYYDEHKDDYFKPESVHLSQIIVDSADEASQVKKELQGGSDFSTLAKERSKDVLTASNGGDLGFVDMDDPFVSPEILERAGELKVGEVSDAIALKEGYALIMVLEKKESVNMPFEQVKKEIKKEIALSEVPPLTQVMSQLRSKYHVELIDK